MEIALFIQNIQEERAEVALYIFTNQTENNNITLWNKPAVMTTNQSSQPFYYRLPHLSTLPSNPHRNRMGIQERFSQTDRALEEVPSWPQVGNKIDFSEGNYSKLFQIDKSLISKVIPIGVTFADPSEAFKSKLKFQIQHEVFRSEED